MAKEEMAKITLKEGAPQENVPQEGKPLTREQVSAYIGQLEDRLRRTSEMLRELKKELEFYQMQDYYQRAQLLCMIISNNNISPQFKDMCQEELKALVYPPKDDTKAEG